MIAELTIHHTIGTRRPKPLNAQKLVQLAPSHEGTPEVKLTLAKRGTRIEVHMGIPIEWDAQTIAEWVRRVYRYLDRWW